METALEIAGGVALLYIAYQYGYVRGALMCDHIWRAWLADRVVTQPKVEDLYPKEKR